MPIPVISKTVAREAAAHLSRHDPVLAPVIAREGLCTIQPHRDYYRELVESIAGQQLSIKAAAAIRKKFLALFDDVFPAPEAILDKPAEDLRAAGLSWAKAKYIRDLAQHVIDGKLKFDHFDSLGNDEIIKQLTDVTGIGEWTAHMFLMFAMGRLDILPTGDLGIRSSLRRLYGFADLPTPAQITALAAKNHWHPYESVAAWYVWAALDNKPKPN